MRYFSPLKFIIWRESDNVYGPCIYGNIFFIRNQLTLLLVHVVIDQSNEYQTIRSHSEKHALCPRFAPLSSLFTDLPSQEENFRASSKPCFLLHRSLGRSIKYLYVTFWQECIMISQENDSLFFNLMMLHVMRFRVNGIIFDARCYL